MVDCDVPAFYTHSEPVARKQHRCVECSAPIEAGEKHFAYRGKWDGQIVTGRQHLVCMQACILIRDKFEGGECIPFGGLKDMFWEMHRDYRCNREHWPKLRRLMATIELRERKAKA